MIVAGKTLVVCGAGSGLGRAVARAALRDGAKVVLGARTPARLAKLAKELDPSGERIAWAETDVRSAEQCQALATLAAERYGGIDALVQVAAFDTPFGGIEEASDEDWRATFEVNVVGTAHMVKAAAADMKARDGGAIVLIGSQAMVRPAVSQIAYAASKGALMSAMYYMAEELGGYGIRVNTVVPTWMWGPTLERYFHSQAEQRGVPVDDVVAEVTRNMPLGRIPADEDVAEAVIFLCSDRSRMITGQSLLVNAGELMR